MLQADKKFKQYATDILSSEVNRVSVNKSAPTPVALVYPNSYAVGISSLGYQTVYRLFNEQPQFACERAFIYEGPLAQNIRTLESQRLLNFFPVIAFSLAYELDYVHALTAIHSVGVKIFAEHRHAHDPLIIFGGVTTFYNPCPIAPFADAILIGEAEVVIPAFTETLNECYKQHCSRNEILENLATIAGVYVPLVHGLNPKATIERQHVKKLDDHPVFSSVVSSKAHLDMFMVEVGRGCGRGCRFCVAGHVYHPFRLRSMGSIIETVEKESFGSKKIGLVGAALSDFPQLSGLAQELVNRNYLLGLSSLRIDSIDDSLIEALNASGVRSITLAPEAGTERLRRIIHKPITDDRIVSAVQKIARSQIQTIKLYFMIGLPFEHEDDLQGVVSLVCQIQKIFCSKQGQHRLRVSINAFIPKAGTPFQWAAMEKESELKRKRRWLTKQLRALPGVIIVPKSAREEIWQGVQSLGGCQISETLADQALKNQFWKNGSKAFIKADFEWLHAERSFEQKLPWDFIDGGIGKDKLWQSWKETMKLAGF